MTAADAVWTLFREGGEARDAAADLAYEVAVDPDAGADDVAKAGTLLFAAGRFLAAERARDEALERGANPVLLAYLDTSCTLASGDGRAARSALAGHLAAAPERLHPDMAWLAAQVGAPQIAWRAARRARLSLPVRLRWTLSALHRRAPRKACVGGTCIPR